MVLVYGVLQFLKTSTTPTSVSINIIVNILGAAFYLHHCGDQLATKEKFSKFLARAPQLDGKGPFQLLQPMLMVMISKAICLNGQESVQSYLRKELSRHMVFDKCPF